MKDIVLLATNELQEVFNLTDHYDGKYGGISHGFSYGADLFLFYECQREFVGGKIAILLSEWYEIKNWVLHDILPKEEQNALR